MPESRERVLRQEDISDVFSRQTAVITETGIMRDDEGVITAIPRPVAVTGGSVRVETRRMRNGRGLVLNGVENDRSGRRGGRGRGFPSTSVLPVWYPRTPLRDITGVIDAIQRRQARLSDMEGEHRNEDIPIVPVVDEQAEGGAHLEHPLSMTSPHTMLPLKNPQPTGKTLHILLDKTNRDVGESQLLTPQKQLLNIVDTFGKVVLKDLQKLKRTPTAKKAERERKTRILRLMR